MFGIVILCDKLFRVVFTLSLNSLVMIGLLLRIFIYFIVVSRYFFSNVSKYNSYDMVAIRLCPIIKSFIFSKRERDFFSSFGILIMGIPG